MTARKVDAYAVGDVIAELLDAARVRWANGDDVGGNRASWLLGKVREVYTWSESQGSAARARARRADPDTTFVYVELHDGTTYALTVQPVETMGQPRRNR